MNRILLKTTLFIVPICAGILVGTPATGEKKHSKRRLKPLQYNNAGPVGEINPTNTRSKEFGSDRRPAILNLNDELRALGDLNAGVLLDAGDRKNSPSKEIFFNKFVVVDDQILLFGDELKGVVTCKKGSGTLILSEGREINTKKSTPDPNARSLQFQDDQLCQTAFAVLRSDPKGQTRLVVVETQSEKVTRFDIR